MMSLVEPKISGLVKVGRALPTAYRHGPATSRPVIVSDEYVGRIVPEREYGRARGWIVYAGAWFEVVPDPDWTPVPGYAEYLARTGNKPEERANMMLGTHRGEPVRYPGFRLAKLPRLSEAIAFAQAWGDWPVQRWIYRAGVLGRDWPDDLGCASSRAGAVETLIDRQELGNGRKARELKATGRIDLSARQYGIDYAFVLRCACPECRAGCTVDNVEEWECSLCQ